MKKTFLFAIFCMALLASCSKDSGINNDKKKSAKFTITAPGLNPAEGDQALMTFTGNSASGGTTTVWKINGVPQENQINIHIGNELLAEGKTVVIETATPMEVMTMVIGGRNIGTPYTVNFKAEVNGSEKNNISEQVVETMSKNFTY